MRRHAEARFQSVAPFVAILSDVQTPFWACGVAGLLGSVSKYLSRVFRAVDQQVWFEEIVKTGFFEHPSHVFFGFLTHVRYDPEPNTAVAQLVEYGRNLRVNVQPLQSMGLLRRKAGGPEGVADIKENRG
jgi:hypothetical protein